VYVIDEGGHLVGAISLKEVFDAGMEAVVGDVMKRDIVSVTPKIDQEQVVLLALQHGLKAIPVTDTHGKFLGIVASDTILSILHNESIEDVLRFAGVHPSANPAKTIITAPALTHIRKRFPWLFLGLGGGIVAALIVHAFEETLAVHLTLAAFIPTVVYMADAVGTQTETIFIRSLALDQRMSLARYIRREVWIGMALAGALGVVTAAISYVVWQSGWLAVVFGISLLVTILAAMVVAIFMPWFLHKINVDPAIASGPFATVIRDVSSILIYFAIAQLVLTFLGV
jgi:magnesium transporter